jgi:hypothetical protein
LNGIVAGYEKKTGKKLNVSHTPISILEENIKNNPQDYISICWLYLDSGVAVLGNVTDNTVWSEWRPKKVVDVVA